MPGKLSVCEITLSHTYKNSW